MSGLPASIELACGCWALTLGVVLHCFWALTKKWNNCLRWLIILIAPTLVFIFSWKPIKKQYDLQHYPTTISKEETHTAQWYLRITKVIVDPFGPNSEMSPVRLTAYVNGQPYG
jgi:hypothetical protein